LVYDWVVGLKKRNEAYCVENKGFLTIYLCRPTWLIGLIH